MRRYHPEVADACASVADGLGEDLMATAGLAASWLLLEVPGRWGTEGVEDSGLSSDLVSALALASRGGVRVLLLRRPTPAWNGSGLAAFVVRSTGADPWAQERALGSVDDVLDGTDLEKLVAGRPQEADAWRPRPAPLFLVCTHSRHDPCCGRLGRPVAKALAAVAVEGTWECTHVGGHRFAANLVCLPHGLYYGRLSPQSAVEAAESYGRGFVELDHYRGRAGWPPAVQAAEIYLRTETGLLGVDDLVLVGHHPAGDGLVDVTFAGRAGDSGWWRVRAGSLPSEEGRPFSCPPATAEYPLTHELVGITQGSGPLVT